MYKRRVTKAKFKLFSTEACNVNQIVFLGSKHKIGVVRIGGGVYKGCQSPISQICLPHSPTTHCLPPTSHLKRVCEKKYVQKSQSPTSHFGPLSLAISHFGCLFSHLPHFFTPISHLPKSYKYTH